jgi:endonuclease/exonuclease/phosphatase family metal-dependent hydrolase
MNYPFTQRITLKILTMNIHAGVGWHGQFCPEKLVDFIKEVNPDLCGFQEVDSKWSWRSRFYELDGFLAEGLMMHPALAPALTHPVGAYGNLILSKFPIAASWAKKMPGRGEPRSFCCVQPDIPGVRILFLTTHLGLSPEDRKAQAECIRAFLRGRREPVILTGDFNADRNEASIRILTAGLYDCHLRGAWRGNGTFRLKDGSIGPRIDYLLFTPQFCLRRYRIFDNFLSDHLPVFAEVALDFHPIGENQA